MKKTQRELPMSRPPLERMMRIHNAIASGDHPNASSLALEFEVSTKTIQRDIDFMRDRMGLPIEYCARSYGFRYTEPVDAFPTLQITEGSSSRWWWPRRRCSSTAAPPSRSDS